MMFVDEFTAASFCTLFTPISSVHTLPPVPVPGNGADAVHMLLLIGMSSPPLTMARSPG